jgi:hypothetical protein
VIKDKNYVGVLSGEEFYWFVVLFHFIKKENFGDGFVKLIQELSSIVPNLHRKLYIFFNTTIMIQLIFYQP